MDILSTVLLYELLFLLTALIVVVTYGLLTNKINTRGLLLDKTSGRAFSPGRLQMLVVTLGIALYYVVLVSDTKDTGRLPDMPHEFLIALGGSHTIYLGGKFYGMLASKLGLASPREEERFKPSKRRMKR